VKNNKTRRITFGGGCFWYTEAIFQEIAGVINTIAGYSGGHTDYSPTYRQICTGITGHAQVVQLEYDENMISYEELLIIFMTSHNPTKNYLQVADKGSQYKSIIFYENENEKAITDNLIKELQPYFNKSIVTEVKRFERFIKAEERFQKYYQLQKQFNYCNTVIRPKVQRFKTQYKERLKESFFTLY